MTKEADAAGGSWVADRFESERSRLRGVAYRMLGSTSEAEDAVQEAWLRLSRSDPDAVDNLSAWLTTVVARISLTTVADPAAARRVTWSAAGSPRGRRTGCGSRISRM